MQEAAGLWPRRPRLQRRVVRSHGGDIKVESIPDLGTTVRIVLPIRQEKIESEPEPETSGDLVIG